MNGVCVRQVYDGRGRRTLRWERVAAGSINIASASYNYDSFDNVLAHSLGSVNATLVQTGTFTYDSQNRVTSGYWQTFNWKTKGDIELFTGLGTPMTHLPACRKHGGRHLQAFGKELPRTTETN